MFSSLKDKLHLDSDLTNKISDGIGKAVEQYKPQVVEFVTNNMGGVSALGLQSDANIEKLARFLYPLLPGVVRMIVKEDAFAAFVLEHRAMISEKIMPMLAKDAQPAFAPEAIEAGGGAELM